MWHQRSRLNSGCVVFSLSFPSSPISNHKASSPSFCVLRPLFREPSGVLSGPGTHGRWTKKSHIANQDRIVGSGGKEEQQEENARRPTLRYLRFFDPGPVCNWFQVSAPSCRSAGYLCGTRVDWCFFLYATSRSYCVVHCFSSLNHLCSRSPGLCKLVQHYFQSRQMTVPRRRLLKLVQRPVRK